MRLEQVYFITDGRYIKIGTTKIGAEKRLKQLNTGSPLRLYLLGYITGGKEKEKELHKKFQQYKVRNNGEWFSPEDDLINYLNKINEKANVRIIKNDLMDNFVMSVLKI